MWRSNKPDQERQKKIIVFLLFLKRLWICLRKLGEEAEDGSEVDKPVYKDKEMLVFENLVLRSGMEGGYQCR